MILKIEVESVWLKVKDSTGKVLLLSILPNSTDRQTFLEEFTRTTKEGNGVDVARAHTLTHFLIAVFGSLNKAADEVFYQYILGGAAKILDNGSLPAENATYRALRRSYDLDVVEIRDGDVFMTDGNNVVGNGFKNEVIYVVN